jgi:uncharacterized phage protein (TIGR01671 family)
MREIKFKLSYWTDERQDTEKEGWIISQGIKLVDFFNGNEDQFDFSDGGYLQFQDVDWDLDKYEWLEYTGLLDKNGKEIYEGDIVKDGNYVGVVEWGVGRAGFIATGGNQSMAMTTRFGSKAKDCEVIGNIYENPELITNLDKKK